MDRLDYLAEAEKQLSNSNSYKEVKLSEKYKIKLVEKSNSMFEGLEKKIVITKKKIKITLTLILKRLLPLGSYIFYLRYIRGSVTYRERDCGTPQKKFRNS